MPWSKKKRSEEHKRRSGELSGALAAYRGPRGIPHVSDAQAGLGQTGRAGSRGGAPIWSAKKGFEAQVLGRYGEHAEADPDGFAVFGRYPRGFLDHVVKAEWLGRIRRDEILHVCSGTLSESEAWTVDVRPQARPRVVADGKCLPFRDDSFAAVMLDPPYSDEYARNLYGIENPRPSWLLKEAARVVRPTGRIGILHVAIPFSPPGCFMVTVWPVTTGVGFRIRALSVYEKYQEDLW